jgi:hypothetical protein
MTIGFVGLYTGDYILVDSAFDVLSLEALFMVPRVCSILSLSPYWGTLIPCLKAMGKDFRKHAPLATFYRANLESATKISPSQLLLIPTAGRSEIHGLGCYPVPWILDHLLSRWEGKVLISAHGHDCNKDLLWVKLCWV